MRDGRCWDVRWKVDKIERIWGQWTGMLMDEVSGYFTLESVKRVDGISCAGINRRSAGFRGEWRGLYLLWGVFLRERLKDEMQ